MSNKIYSLLGRAGFIAGAVLFLELTSGPFLRNSGAAADSKAYVTTAANGERIPNPISKAVYAVKDGAKTIQVPEGMVYVPDGSFVMGNGNTAHTVKLSAYCIGKFEVTNAEFKAFCDEMGGSYRPHYWGTTDADVGAFLAKKGNHPVLGISYVTGMEYCAWVGKKTGWKVTLPSEAQWERAARGPTTDGSQYLYPWGNETSPDDYIKHATYMSYAAAKYGKPKKEVTYGGKVYWVYWPFVIDPATGVCINQRQISHREDNADNPITTDIDEMSEEVKAVWDSIQALGGGTSEVGSHDAGPAGCYDMAGNAYEVTRDWYTVSYYITLAGKVTDPVVEDESVLTKEDKLGGSDGNFKKDGVGTATKVCRGGSWYAQESSGQTFSRRETRAPGSGTNTMGFRVAMENPKRINP
jgi:formylglycine-generating enzyme required for sulfatase activity